MDRISRGGNTQRNPRSDGSAFQRRPAFPRQGEAPRAAEVRTTGDFGRFLGGLEERYPEASSFDLNRAIRQHYYGGDGTKNDHPVFDQALGADGGRHAPGLEGIEGDLRGLPGRVTTPDGDTVDLSHAAVGIDSYYERRMEDRGWFGSAVDAAQGFALTHGGDLAQTALAGAQAFTDWMGLTDTGETASSALAYSSDDQLRGNSAGLSIGAELDPAESLSQAWSEYFRY